ncbi:MAG TPA: hypothetical protein PLK28_16675 [Candidatus Rifleibacterium sp.]|nr:hypothetical protein [Candidatus Rifleibacterium sp.]
MVDNHQIDYTENTFYRTFPQHSFASRIARWVKAFSYSFIALSVFSIILEHLQHYCITPPGMFFQFLFALLMAGIIEVICIQMSNVSDHTVLDYTKNLVTVIQHRFILRKVVVLASFEQVRVVGVSSRPPTLLGHLFADPLKRYALVIMNYRNHLIQITEYEMTLDDANELATELANRHMPSARFIMGEPDTELVADALTGDVSTRPVKHSLAAMIDATILPALQAFCALMITAAIVSISMLAISRVSTHVFDTDLLVAHQPVTQLFLRPVARVDKTATQQQPGFENPASATVVLSTPTVATDTMATLPAPTASESATAAAVTHQPDSDPALIVPAASDTAVETVLYQASETANPEPPSTSVTEKDPSAATESDTSAAGQEPVQTAAGQAPESSPESSEKSVATPATTDTITAPPAEIFRPIPQKAGQSRQTQQITATEMSYGLIPVNDSLAVRIPAVPTDAMQSYGSKSGGHTAPPVSVAAMPQPSVSRPATTTRECSILAGFGLHPLVNLGEIDSDLEATLGKPIATQKTVGGIQKIYNGFTVLSDEHGKVVKQIIITRKTVNKDFLCQTPQQIGVGSPLELLRTRFGPPTLLTSVPGLHFPGLGISFIPAPSMPDKIGAIKIYPIGTRPE